MGGLLPAPLSAWVDAPGVYSGPILLLGHEGEDWFGVVDDGGIRTFPWSTLTVDWRYDWRNQAWIEVSGVGEEEPSDDGGEDLSGSISDADGAGAGDPLDEEGRAPTGDPGDVDTSPPSGEA